MFHSRVWFFIFLISKNDKNARIEQAYFLGRYSTLFHVRIKYICKLMVQNDLLVSTNLKYMQKVLHALFNKVKYFCTAVLFFLILIEAYSQQCVSNPPYNCCVGPNSAGCQVAQTPPTNVVYVDGDADGHGHGLAPYNINTFDTYGNGNSMSASDKALYESWALWDHDAVYNSYLCLPFRMLRPLNYNQSSSKLYPLIIMLHGLGEAGTDNNRVIFNGGQAHVNAVKSGTYDGFVVFPQAPDGNWAQGNPEDTAGQVSPQLKRVFILVDSLVRRFKIDPDRVVVHGLSAGGTGTLSCLYHRPDLFAAALPMSATTTTGDINNAATQQKVRANMGFISPVPLWWFQGSVDINPPPTVTTPSIGFLRDSGATNTNLTRYTIYQGVGHGTWTYAYAEPDFFPFIQRQNKRHIYLMGSNPICYGQSTMLAFSPGFYNYQWYKDGVALAGQTTNRLKNITVEGKYYVQCVRRGYAGIYHSDTVTITKASIPLVTANQSLILPSPSSSTVTLFAPAGYSAYAWSTGATTQQITVSATGDYSVQASNGTCFTPVSNIYHVQSGAMGSPIPAMPTGLSATATSPVNVVLSWLDNATDETGYEIYRSTTSASGPFIFMGLLPANTISFVDNTVEPQIGYYYKVRAVNLVAASLSDETAYVKTFKLNYPGPSAPASLTLTSINEQGLTMKWNKPTTNYSLRRYMVYSGTNLLGYSMDTTFFYTGMTPGTNYAFTVQLEDTNGNVSGKSNTVFLAYSGQGLFANRYDGYWTTIPSFQGRSPKTQGWVAQPSITNGSGTTVSNLLTGNDLLIGKTSKDSFSVYFRGYINIATAGTYTFYLKSDDGSKLYIGDSLIVSNDGAHDNTNDKPGTYAFSGTGWFPFRVDYLEIGGNQSLVTSYSGPSFSEKAIPSSVLATTSAGYGSVTTSPPTATANGFVLSDGSTKDKIKVKIKPTYNNLSADVYSFELYRVQLSSGNPTGTTVWSLIATIPRVGTTSSLTFTYLDTVGLAANTQYFYAVKVLGTSGSVLFWFTTPFQSITTPNKTILPPGAPFNLQVAKTNLPIKTLTYTDTSNKESGFEIFRSLNRTSNYQRINILPANVITYKDSSALPNIQYYYQVRAYNQGGVSAFCTPDSTIVPNGTYYSKSNGNLQTLGTWGVNVDGTGQSPIDFSSSNQTFIVANRPSGTVLTSTWNVNGSNSKIVVNPGNILTVADGVVLNGSMQVMQNAKVRFKTSSLPTITSVDSTSTLIFSNGTTLPNIVYGNLQLDSVGSKLSNFDTLVVKGNLLLSGPITFTGKPTGIKLYGNLVYSDTFPTFNNVSLLLKKQNHLLDVKGGTVSLSTLQYNNNSKIVVLNSSKLVLGSNTGGGLYPGQGSLLSMGSGRLSVLGMGALNPLNKTGELAIQGGSLRLISTTTLPSYLYLSDTAHTVKDIQHYNLGGNKLELKDSLFLTGTLKLGFGTFKTNDLIVLVSNLTGTSRISKVETGAVLDGNVTWQRLVGPNKIQSYFTLSNPIVGQKVGRLKKTIPSIAGLNSSGYPSISYLDETSNGWIGIKDSNTIMQPGQGYRVYMKTSDLTYASNSGFYQFKGQPVIGNGNGDNAAAFTIPITMNGSGWNYVGNPYPCEIDWDAPAGWDKSHVDNTLYVWDSKYRVYNTYNTGLGTGTPALTSILNAGQAFLVLATTNNSFLSMTEDVKVVPNSPMKFYRMESAIPAVLKIQMSNPDSSVIDEADIRFLSGASLTKDAYDSPKLPGSVENISTLAGTFDFAINTLPYASSEMTVPVHIQGNKGGTYSLHFSNAETFLPQSEIYLHDKDNDSLVDIKMNASYKFSYGAAFDNTTRFEIVFRNLPLDQVLDYESNVLETSSLHVFPNPASHTVTFQLDYVNAGEAKMEIYNVSGKEVFKNVTVLHSGTNLITWDIQNSHVSKGIYLYKINVAGKVYDGKLIVN
jgi:predicted esterase